MSVAYYKRYRMEADLRRSWRPSALPTGYRYAAWAPQRLAAHVEVKRLAFSGEVDAEVFECLASEAGCQRLMEEIAAKPGFAPEATWLVECVLGPAARDGQAEPCAAIQGVRADGVYGAIQNLGVTPWHRHRGLGRALVQAALFGFKAIGMERAALEVTAENVAAVRLYESLGFRRVKTLYRAVEQYAAEEAVGSRP